MMEELKKKFLSLNALLTLLSERRIVALVLLGLILIGFGVFFARNVSVGGTKIEVLEKDTQEGVSEIIVEIVGAIEKPGVYKLVSGSRVDDLLMASGGFSGDADREWTNKYLNRAAKLTDGQKIYIPSTNEQTLGATASTLTNINTASLTELDKLPGIGPVYGQSIIDHRPYSTVEELLSKGALKKSVYEKIKDLVSVY